jgi:hypothetical protein
VPSSSPLAAATSSNVEKVRIPLPPGAAPWVVGYRDGTYRPHA